MPIDGLTNQPGKLPELGRLHKGTEKERRKQGDREYEVMGRDLGPKLRFSTSDAAIEAAWMDAFGDMQVDRLQVALPFATTDENLDAWREAYGRSGMIRRCTGSTCVWHRDAEGRGVTEPTACAKPNCYQVREQGKTVWKTCTPHARLRMFVPELMLRGHLGVVICATTSGNDVRNLDAQLRGFEAKVGDLRRLVLMLRRFKTQVPSITENGRIMQTVWLLRLDVDPEWARELFAMPALPAPAVVVAPALELTEDPPGEGGDDDAGELVEEYVEEGVFTDADDAGVPPVQTGPPVAVPAPTPTTPPPDAAAPPASSDEWTASDEADALIIEVMRRAAEDSRSDAEHVIPQGAAVNLARTLSDFLGTGKAGDTARHQLLHVLFGKTSTKELIYAEFRAIKAAMITADGRIDPAKAETCRRIVAEEAAREAEGAPVRSEGLAPATAG